MCGIVGYVGEKNAKDVVMAGLVRLEYRGYDSAGLAVSLASACSPVHVEKALGPLKFLQEQIRGQDLAGSSAIGHTRWATHGVPSKLNAHPHQYGRVTLVHNGIIENHAEIKKQLQASGHIFSSQTDTEVAAHLLDHFLSSGLEPVKAIAKLCDIIHGAFAFGIMIDGDQDHLYFARFGSPLVVAQQDGGCFFASDQAALVDYQPHFYRLSDGEIGFISREKIYVCDLRCEEKTIHLSPMTIKAENAEKDGHKHFMHKEIFEQPQTVRTVLLGKVKDGRVNLDGFALNFDRIKMANRIQIIACGSSYLAGLMAKNELEGSLKIPVAVDIASEYRYRQTLTDHSTLVIAISQSGETADTLAALLKAKSEGALCMAICNVLGSAIASFCESEMGCLYLNAGPEISVASTKAFLAQSTALKLFALALAKVRGVLDPNLELAYVANLLNLPENISCALEQDDAILELAKTLLNQPRMLYIGRGESFVAALEGALKMKELAYIFAEGYPAGELKHGPIALIDDGMPALVIFGNDKLALKTASNLAEMKARGAKIISIAPRGLLNIREDSDVMIELPDAGSNVQAILSVIPLQLLAYHLSVLKGFDADKPKNLAKSVTVK